MRNILDNIDRLIKDVSIINESDEKKSLDINPEFETPEQARTMVRNMFKDQYFKVKPPKIDPDGLDKDKDEEENDWPTPPTDNSKKLNLPNPFKKDGSSGTDTTFGADETEWKDDDIETINVDDEDEDDEDDSKKDDLYDDFKSDDDSEEGEGEDGEDGDGEDDGDGEGEGEGKSSDGEGGEGSSKPSGEKDGEDGSDDDLKKDLKDALEKAGKKDGKDYSKILDKLDELDGEDGESISDEMSKMRKEIDKEASKGSTHVGGMDAEMTDDELKKELEKHGYKSDDIEKNLDAKNAETPLTDEKEEEMKKRAMDGFEKKSKGSSKISKAILMNALKNREFTEGVWDEIIEKIVKEKSRRAGKEDSKHKTIRYGNKNHLWRGAVLPTYKTESGYDKKKIYCFVDWSSSVTSVKGLIESFLAKVLHVSEKLDYGDIDVYGFGNRLSLPRTITKEMREDSGLSTVLTETRSYMNSQHLGGGIENFDAVAHEINIIKSKDEEAIIFIFGDGVWTLYGNDQPPIRLKEICPEYLDDIYAFVFYKKEFRENEYSWDYLMKEVSLLVDSKFGVGLGSDHVILSQMNDIV